MIPKQRERLNILSLSVMVFFLRSLGLTVLTHRLHLTTYEKQGLSSY